MNEQGIRFAISADDRATRVFAGVRKELQSVQGAAGSLRSALSTFAPTVAAAFSLAAITAFVRTTVNGIDALNDLADATGSSVENLSALEDVAARTGTSMDTVGGAVIRLNKALADAKPGSDQAKALEAIGLSAKELRAIDPAEALQRTAKALAGFADDGNKARLVQELFGKSLREVAPLLKDLAESGKLNSTVTTEQAKQAEAFNQQLFRFQKNATDAARAISGPLVSSLNDFFGVIRKLDSNKGGFFAGVAEQFNIDFLRARLTASKEEIARLAPGAERARALLAVQPDSIRAKSTLAEFTQLQKAADEYAKKIDEILYAGKGGRPANEGGGKLRVPKLPDLAGGEKMDTGAAKRLTEYLAMAKARAEGEEQAARDASEAWQAWEEIQLKEHKQTTDAWALQWKQVLDEIDAEQERAIEAGAALVATKAEESNEFATQAARNIQDALGESLVRAFDGSFKSIGGLWVSTLQKMVAQALAAKLNSYLFGDTFGSKGDLGGFVGSLFAGTFFGGARANGGPVSAGRAYLVGERGPEIMVPGSSGTVLPNGAGMGGSVNIYQTLNIGQGVSRGEVYAAAMQAKDAAKAEIMQTLYRTGRGAYA
jgi:hypothetical protein